uniref:Uncharacterized protein n=1 Tax=Meloidogyne enterolobii TaxID=390850 RepID=A0A6V7VT59_MELEN|nr:unnamed protein product [Meloidogyne enterolobii]
MYIPFTASYLAWESGFETWIRKDGVMPAFVAKNSKYSCDERINKWSEITYTKSVAHFKRASLTKVEYALLIAIIFTKSDAKGLSPKGKEVLYNESVKFTKILLRYNQRRLGVIEGAQRLDECFRLINVAIENEHFMRLMLHYHTKYYSMNSIKLNYSMDSTR